ncbi:hypothetical protein D3C72_1981360 [compost metagenome]
MALDLPKPMAPLAPPCIRFMMKNQKAMISATGSSRPSRPDHQGWRVLLTSTTAPAACILSTRSMLGRGVTVVNLLSFL